MATVTATDIQTLYVAYFNRPADPVYLQQWIDKANAEGGSTALPSIAQEFAASSEYTTTYAGMSATSIVDALYVNLFGRHAEPAGLLYWANKLTTGTETIGSIAYTIASSAQNADLVAVNSKVAAAGAFTTSLLTNSAGIVAYDGAAADAVAKTWLSGVVDAASLAASTTADALSAVTTNVIAAHDAGVNVGSTFTLTSNVDSFTGTTGNDTFVAGLTGIIDPSTGIATFVDTLQDQDTLVGNGGTDTLKVTLGAATTAGVVTPTLTGIANIVATFKPVTAGTPDSLSLANATGVTKVSVDSSTAVGTITNVGGAALAVTNQTVGANFDGSTATALNITATVAGTSTTAATIDAGHVTASAATSLVINTTNSFINLADTVANTGVLAASINATGTNAVSFDEAAGAGATLTSLTVTGTGSVDVTGGYTAGVVNDALVALKTLTVSDGGITFDNTGSTATSFTATVGNGVNSLTLEGANVKTITAGDGGNTITIDGSALDATAKIVLGAGDDTVAFAAGDAFAAGATITAGAGTNTLEFASADYAAVSGYTAAKLALVTGFEVLGFSDAVTAGTYDVSVISGIGSFTAFDGIAAAGGAAITGLSANSTITLEGDLGTNNGAFSATLATDTSADVLNLVINGDYADLNSTTAVDAADFVITATTSGVETVKVDSTAHQTATFTPVTGYEAAYVTNTLNLTDTKLTTLDVTGDQEFHFATNAGMTKLALIDASAATATVDINASAQTTTAVALTIKGSATADSILTGSHNSDTIIGGTGNDVITGNGGSDTLTGGGGDNEFVFNAGDSTIVTGNTATITDFHANTVGQGTAGAATSAGATLTGSALTGDVIELTHGGATSGIAVGVYTNAADAQTFLQTANHATVNAALDSSTGNLYIDLDGNGTVDLFIHLTGVTTLTTAAFHVA